MKDVLVEVKRKSELEAKTEYEYKKIMINDNAFVPCKISIKDESIEIEYKISGLKESKDLKNDLKENILIFLLNVSNLERKILEYNISLNPSNLFYDYKYDVKIKDRDIKREVDRFDEDEFLKQYKSLIGFMLQNKYSYEDYFQGGLDLLKKNKYLAKIYKENTLASIKDLLLKELETLRKDTTSNKILVPKSTLKHNKRVKILLSVLVIFLGGYFVYNMFILRPYNNQLIDASNAFIQSDYDKVITSLKNIKTENLPKESKYILANSFVNSENLSANQKKNILSTISVQTQEDILDFWIQQGNLELDDAIDTAKRLGDNELLMYALIKKEQQILNDSSLSGEKKEETLNKVKDEIEKLSKGFKENQETGKKQ